MLGYVADHFLQRFKTFSAKPPFARATPPGWHAVNWKYLTGASLSLSLCWSLSSLVVFLFPKRVLYYTPSRDTRQLSNIAQSRTSPKGSFAIVLSFGSKLYTAFLGSLELRRNRYFSSIVPPWPPQYTYKRHVLSAEQILLYSLKIFL